MKPLTQKRKITLAKKHNCTVADIEKMLAPNPNYKPVPGFEHFDHTSEELKKLPRIYFTGKPKLILG